MCTFEGPSSCPQSSFTQARLSLARQEFIDYCHERSPSKNQALDLVGEARLLAENLNQADPRQVSRALLLKARDIWAEVSGEQDIAKTRQIDALLGGIINRGEINKLLGNPIEEAENLCNSVFSPEKDSERIMYKLTAAVTALDIICEKGSAPEFVKTIALIYLDEKTFELFRVNNSSHLTKI